MAWWCLRVRGCRIASERGSKRGEASDRQSGPEASFENSALREAILSYFSNNPKRLASGTGVGPLSAWSPCLVAGAVCRWLSSFYGHRSYMV